MVVTRHSNCTNRKQARRLQNSESLMWLQDVSIHRFSTEINSGLVEVIAPPATYYPDLTNLKETFGDSKERVRLVYSPRCFSISSRTHTFFVYEMASGMWILEMFSCCNSWKCGDAKSALWIHLVPIRMLFRGWSEPKAVFSWIHLVLNFGRTTEIWYTFFALCGLFCFSSWNTV